MSEPEDYRTAIKEDIERVNQELQLVQNEGHEGKRVKEALWPIMRLHSKRSRIVFEALEKGEISISTMRWCADQGICDPQLLSKWRKPGYRNLCCMLCIQPNHTCICRVPKRDRPNRATTACEHCGCTGCADQDCCGFDDAVVE